MKHPVRTNRVQLWIARTSWFGIVLLFLIYLAVASLLLAAPATDWMNFQPTAALQNATQALMALCDVAELPPHFGQGAAVAAGILKVLSPAFILGAAVYKISIPANVYIPRGKLSIKFDANGDPIMYFRSYNASGMPAVDLKFEFYIRHSKFSHSGDFLILNVKVEPLKPSDTPPVMLPWVPHSVGIKLDRTDVRKTEAGWELAEIQSRACLPERDAGGRHPGECYLLVIISGWLPQLGSQFVEMESYRLSGPRPEYEFGDFTHIDVLPPKGRLETHDGRPKGWKGWKRFDHLLEERE